MCVRDVWRMKCEITNSECKHLVHLFSELQRARAVYDLARDFYMMAVGRGDRPDGQAQRKLDEATLAVKRTRRAYDEAVVQIRGEWVADAH